MIKKCLRCDIEFEAKRKNIRYCEAKCRRRAMAQRARDLVKKDVPNEFISRYPKINRKPIKQTKYATESVKSCWDYWQG